MNQSGCQKISYLIALFFLTPLNLRADSVPIPKTTESPRCESAKEFITTFEYLRDASDLAGSGDNAVKIASQVAEGCTGSAKRFIQTLQFLNKVELPLQEILSTAIDFAKKEDTNVEAFNQIFKRLYAEDGFDLDIGASLKIAKSIGVEYPGNVKNALRDFERISAFCFKGDELFLPKPDCAELAKRISLYGKENRTSAAEAFISGYKYIKETVGLTSHDALKISEQLVGKDPQAFENFKLSYEYAMSEKGLKANKEQAVRFSKKMADLTVKETKSSVAK
jgi:hypothetical protein